MLDKGRRLKKNELNTLFINGLDSMVSSHSGEDIIAWPALKEFINNNGKMRIVCSPYVSEADAAALSEGYSARTDEILNRAIEQEVQRLQKQYPTNGDLIIKRVERCQGSTRRTLLRLGYKTGEGVYLNMQQVVVRPSLQCVQSMTP